MERFVAWISGLEPLTVYLITGIATFFENLIPPIPSDVIAALGGFLTQRSPVSGVTVFLVAWLSNLTGAVMLYYIARRHGRRFIGSRLGQRLLPADAIIDMEREYIRFGVVGIFVSRFLPGFRSFVAPFVGLVNLPPLAALLPMALASAIWYAGIVWLGSRLGQQWETIARFLGTLNRTLAVVALVLAGLIGVWIYRRAAALRPRRARLVRIVRRALGDTTGEPEPELADGDLATQGAAAFLFEITHADPALSLEERDEIAGFLRESWGLGAHRLSGAMPGPAPEDTREFASILAADYDRERRLALLERLYAMATKHGTLTRHEERLMRRAVDLLGLLPADQVEARQRALGR